MKMKLPKALLCAVLASLLVGHADATISVETNAPDRPDVIKVVTSGTEDIKADYASYNGKVNPEEHTQKLALIYLKDGEGSATITGVTNEETGEQETLQSDVRLYVREGAVEVKDIAITQKCYSEYDFVVVAGGSKEVGEDGKVVKDTTAKMVLDNASIIQTDEGGYSGFMKTVSVGNKDGEGSLLLTNNSVIKSGQLFHVGNYSYSNACHGTYKGTEGDALYNTSGETKQGYVRVEQGSKIYAGQGLYGGKMLMEIDGENSAVIVGTRNIDNSNSINSTMLGSIAGCTSEVHIKNGGSMENYNQLFMSTFAAADSIVKVDGKNSLFAGYSVSYLGYNDGANASISATNQSMIHLTDAMMGRKDGTGAATIEIDATSSYTGSALYMYDGAAVENNGKFTLADGSYITKWRDDANVGVNASSIMPESTEQVSSRLYINGGVFANNGTLKATTIDLYKGVLTNSGTIEAGLNVDGGMFEMVDGAVAAGLTATAGTINLSGDVTFTGKVMLGADMMAAAEGDAASPLTINITQGTTLIFENQVELSNAVINVLLSDEAYEGEQLFTIASVDGLAFDELAGVDLQLKYNGVDKGIVGAAGYVTNTIIPEPTTATLSLLALMGLAARRRRK